MKIGDEVYVHGYVDEIRKGTYVDIVIIRNKGGYFGTDASEVIPADRKTENCDDLIRRSDAIESFCNKECSWGISHNFNCDCELKNKIKAIPAVEPKQEWIPCEERLPEDIRPVIVTWKNNDPKSYYQYIVGKHFIGTAHYYRGKWYWYSSVTEDLLAEYGKCETEEFDEAIEAVAWMPLPEPYMKGADNE